MERKEFIKKSCTACLAIGAGWMLTELAACAHIPMYKAEVKDNKVAVPLSMFASTDVQIISVKGIDYDIAIRKEKDGSYTALLMRCTHADNALNNTGNGFTCSLHGSTFDREGIVTQGPAEQNLKRYPTTTNATDLIININ
jgi:Rieske Fe-S protein